MLHPSWSQSLYGSPQHISIYTQVSDVEDEINGLLTYDRKLCKLTQETMVPVAEALRAALEK